MLSFIRNFFWPPSRIQQLAEPVENQNFEVPATQLETRKRKAPEENASSTENIKKVCSGAESQGTWTLDIEQADFRFSKETLAIFAGRSSTSLISRRAGIDQSHCGARRQQDQSAWRPRTGNNNSGTRLTVLSQLTNLADYYFRHDYITAASPPLNSSRLFEQPQPVSIQRPDLRKHRTEAVAAVPQQTCVHSTPLVVTAMFNAIRAKNAASTEASTVPKSLAGATAAAAAESPLAAAAPSADAQIRTHDVRHRQQAGSENSHYYAAPSSSGDNQNDEDCVITSIEEPKSVTEIFSPCKYLSSDWLDDIKTSSQSLKTYIHRTTTEENLKMQYWAKKREADERDLVARVTRNLKLAERELPVLPYKYEEPPPTPPPELAEEEESEPEFPELTDEQLLAVERAWSRQLPGGDVLAEGFSLRVTREEMRSLSGLNWLNDNIVNFYMQLIAARSGGPGLPKVHAFSTFFYTKLSSSGYASVRRWTRKVDIFDCEILLCPVHLHNNHWTLCIVDLRSRHIIYLDSLSMGSGASCLPLMRQYLAEEHRDKKSGAELPGLSEFQLIRETGAPQQENGSDCGVFVCKFADFYCKLRDFTFSQANMPYFRKRITVEILEKRLLW